MKQLYLNHKLFNGTEEEFLAIKEFRCKEWKLNGKWHRDSGPAVIWSDGPAVIHSNGYQAWCQNNKLHRTDGPAVIHSDGHKEYWLDGFQYSEKEFIAKLESRKQNCENTNIGLCMNGFTKEDSQRMTESLKKLCEKHLKSVHMVRDAMAFLRTLPKQERDAILEMNGLLEKEAKLTTEEATQEVIEISKKMRELVKGELKNDPLMLDEIRITDRKSWAWEWILNKTLIRVYTRWREEDDCWVCDITFPIGKAFIDTTRCVSTEGPFEAVKLAVEDFWNGVDSKLSEIPRPA